jgi:hypothetical protein
MAVTTNGRAAYYRQALSVITAFLVVQAQLGNLLQMSGTEIGEGH